MQTTVDATAQILAALARQNELLQAILGSLNKPTFGLLGSQPGTTRVYCNRDRCPGALWYTLNDSREPVALPAKAIRGYLKALRFEQTERRGKSVWKLYTLIDCGDTTYELESGSDSVFSKGLLMAIATIEAVALKLPISIGVAAGDDESVLLCRVWRADNSSVFAKWEAETDWKLIAQRAIAKVEAKENH